ncbi:hypothetical protein ACF1G5_22860 [Streptomyces coeruleorubidus]|uniref:hypothetical protein n=1 Tax=Streptomyces coeruleorubidus TaxID=116188 RepID=UPI0036FE6113
MALECQTVYSSEAFGSNGDLTGDGRLAVAHPEQVAGVLFIPNDQSYDRRSCEQDIKDGGVADLVDASLTAKDRR